MNPFADENFNWNLHYQKVRRLKNSGYVELPGWFPSGGYRADIYKYEIVDDVTAMMKPAPLLRHRIKFGLKSFLRKIKL
jgi:hypothetical protein